MFCDFLCIMSFLSKTLFCPFPSPLNPQQTSPAVQPFASRWKLTIFRKIDNLRHCGRVQCPVSGRKVTVIAKHLVRHTRLGIAEGPGTNLRPGFVNYEFCHKRDLYTCVFFRTHHVGVAKKLSDGRVDEPICCLQTGFPKGCMRRGSMGKAEKRITL